MDPKNVCVSQSHEKKRLENMRLMDLYKKGYRKRKNPIQNVGQRNKQEKKED